MTRNGWWALGSLLSAVTAIAGQAELLPEPWRHYVTVAGIMATALSAINAHWPRRPDVPRPPSASVPLGPPIALEPGDVLLYAAKGLYGRVIALKTWHPIAHVECFVGNGLSVASRDGIGTGTYPLRTDDLVMVCRSKLPLDLDRAKALFAERRHRPYGWVDLLQFAGVNIDTPGIVCSPFVTEFLRDALLDPFNGEPCEKIAPFQFLTSPVFTNLPYRSGEAAHA